MPIRTTYASGKWKASVYNERGKQTGKTYSIGGDACDIERDEFDRIIASTGDWYLSECHDFVWDDWNIIHETVSITNGGITNVSEIQYFWGNDLAGTLQGVGGVGGLIAVSRNEQFYFPIYDNNGNVLKYVDEEGVVVSSYLYDDFGGNIFITGDMATAFSFRFSTKYFDEEIGLIAYELRNFKPLDKYWINRDPAEEMGGG